MFYRLTFIQFFPSRPYMQYFRQICYNPLHFFRHFPPSLEHIPVYAHVLLKQVVERGI